MRGIIGFLGSVGVGVIVTAAGIVLDANTLLYSGIAILALMLALWIYTWATANPQPAPAQAPARPLLEDSAPADASEKDKALFAIRRARDNARIAIANKSAAQAHRAFHEIQAALVSAKRQFEIPIPSLTGNASYLEYLGVYVAFINSFYPHLCEGHLDVAKSVAGKFKYP